MDTDTANTNISTEVWLVDHRNQESFGASGFDMTERQTRLIDEYREWDQIRSVCCQYNLPIGIKQAHRQMDFIRKDFLQLSISRGLLVGIVEPYRR